MIEAEVALKLDQDAHRAAEAELKVDKRALKLELKEQELSHQVSFAHARLTAASHLLSERIMG